MEKYIVSSCLAGIPCRYDCSHKNNKYINDLIRDGKAIPLCPEQMAGLPTPREACECKIVNGKQRIYSKSGKDYTDYLFPDTDSWKETRDVLLIAIYERLHDRNIDIK